MQNSYRSLAHRVSIHTAILALGLFLCLSATLLVFSNVARAQEFSWTDGMPTASVRTDLMQSSDNSASLRKCTMQKVSIGSGFSPQDTMCIYQADGFRYGFLNKWISTSLWTGYSDESFVIGFPYEDRMYRVEGLPIRDIIFIPHSKNLVFREARGGVSWGYNLNIIKDVRSKLRRVSGPDLSIGYKLIDNASEPLLKNEYGDPGLMHAVGVSDSGKWLAVELRPSGLLRINMETFDMKWFSLYSPRYGIGMDAKIDFAISDDGRYIATAGWNAISEVTVIDEKCGRDLRIFKEAWRNGDDTLTNPCPARGLSTILDEARGGNMRSAEIPYFTAGGAELIVLTIPSQRPDITLENKWISLRANGYRHEQIDYLALGDSYSSGEGDTEVDPKTKDRYYIAHTNDEGSNYIPREKCHISARSYPFLLGAAMNIQSNMMQSVVCSGALVEEDYAMKSAGYLGQRSGGGPRLAQLNQNDIKQYQTQALNEFIPGRIQQIEFVKKYTPKVVTLTGGGNDVDFGSIIKACVSLGKKETCDYATKDRELTAVAGDISDQYDKLIKLYRQLHDASPSTKFYVVGYPQFVSDRHEKCALNVLLDKQERTYVRHATSYLNGVIKAAANAEGMMYIDIEDSLEADGIEHTLCGAGKAYVTGANLDCSDGNLAFLKNLTDSECQEAYHPNAKGHEMIADMIKGRVDNLLTYNKCSDGNSICPILSPNPSTPDYFVEAVQKSKDAEVAAAHHARLVEKEYIQKRKMNAQLSLQASSLYPNSTAKVLLHSEPTLVGEFPVDAYGDLNLDVAVPDAIPAGYHTLHVIGQSYSGEDIDLWQIIEVRGVDGDIDENGIPDSEQQCLYTPASGVDADRDGIDDVCDVVIDDPPSGILLSQRDTSLASSRVDLLAYGTIDTVRFESIVADGQVAGVRSVASRGIDIIATKRLFWPIPTSIAVIGLLISAGLFLKNRHNKKHNKSK